MFLNCWTINTYMYLWVCCWLKLNILKLSFADPSISIEEFRPSLKNSLFAGHLAINFRLGRGDLTFFLTPYTMNIKSHKCYM